MGKVIVKKVFYDRETGELRREGEEAEYRDERVRELVSGGFAEPAAAAKPAPKKRAKKG